MGAWIFVVGCESAYFYSRSPSLLDVRKFQVGFLALKSPSAAEIQLLGSSTSRSRSSILFLPCL